MHDAVFKLRKTPTAKLKKVNFLNFKEDIAFLMAQTKTIAESCRLHIMGHT